MILLQAFGGQGAGCGGMNVIDINKLIRVTLARGVGMTFWRKSFTVGVSPVARSFRSRSSKHQVCLRAAKLITMVVMNCNLPPQKDFSL